MTESVQKPEAKSKPKPLPNIDDMTVQDLTALIEEAQKVRSVKLEGEKAALVAEIRERAAALGVTVESLFPQTSGPEQSKARRGGPTRKVAPKYRGPNDETWSGRGRNPGWLEKLITEGRDPEEFRVDSTESPPD